MLTDVNHIHIHENCCLTRGINSKLDVTILSRYTSKPGPWLFPNEGLDILVGPRKSWQHATKDTDLRMGSDQEDDADDGDDLAKIYDHLDALAALGISYSCYSGYSQAYSTWFCFAP